MEKKSPKNMHTHFLPFPTNNTRQKKIVFSELQTFLNIGGKFENT